MDIEEEDPTDSPFCNEREKNAENQLPSCIEQGMSPQICEWDYLQVKTPFQSYSKLCNFVEKDGSYFIGQDLDAKKKLKFTVVIGADLNGLESWQKWLVGW